MTGEEFQKLCLAFRNSEHDRFPAQTVRDAAVELEWLAALAQSDAEPVAWRYKPTNTAQEWAITIQREPECKSWGWVVEPLYTSPPRPDASVGLIDAAKWHEARAREYGPLPEHGATVTKALQIFQRWNLDCAEALRSRAAERSRK